MNYPAIVVLGGLLQLICYPALMGQDSKNYLSYHQRIDEAESAIADELYEEALVIYEQVIADYDFVFLRDMKVATQLAYYVGREDQGDEFLKMAVASGWSVKSARKNKYLSEVVSKEKWRSLEAVEDSSRREVNEELREQVREMYKKDQGKALAAFIKLREKSRLRYTREKFAPHSEGQMLQLIEILDDHGYPGERLIGNNYWMSTVVSHHNSISPNYSQQDTLYGYVRPILLKALEQGQISPYELALMEDWQIAVASNRQDTGYGYLDPPTKSTLQEANDRRQVIGLRSIGLRNRLVDLQQQTGMSFYLPDWVDGAIEIREE